MKNNVAVVSDLKNHPDVIWEKIRNVVNRIRVLDEINPKAIPRTIDSIENSIYELLSLLEQYDKEKK